MKKETSLKFALAGGAAGMVNGLFGAGGGMVLVPLLTLLTDLDESEVFPTSVSVIFPICIVSFALSLPCPGLHFSEIWPYLLGGAIGGILSGIAGRKIPLKWMHRILGLFILWGGVKYLC